MSESGDSPQPKSLTSLLERLPVMVAIASTSLYVFGFTVVTSYLASKGIYDQSLLSTKYILAGALTAAVALAYYFFVWRKVMVTIREGVSWPTKANEIGRAFLDAYPVVEHAFACCFVATMLLMLMGHKEYILVQVVILIAFLVDMTLVHLGIYARLRKTCYGLTFVLYSFATIVCLWNGFVRQPLLELVLIFFTVTFVGSMVLTSSGWTSGIDRAFGIFYITLYVLLGVVGFGATVYEHINPKFGGAAPSLVSVHLSSEAPEPVAAYFKNNADNVYLILETDTSATFRIGQATEKPTILQVDRKLVTAIKFHPQKQGESTTLSLTNGIKDPAVFFEHLFPSSK